MIFVTGRFDLENLAPERLIGFYKDIQHNGNTLYALCFWKWFAGIEI